MAYRSLERESSYAYGSSSSCLDGVPFRISQQFQMPNRIRIDIDLTKKQTHSDEYNFEIEEGVMKWAEERERAIERERQLQAQKLEEELRTGNVNRGPIHIPADESDSEPEDEWLKNNRNNTDNIPSQTAKQNGQRNRPKPPPRPPQPRGPVISSDILTPVQISSANSDNASSVNISETVDVTLFETEDDPFDRFERQTLNDLEELKTVFQCSNQTTESQRTQPTNSSQPSHSSENDSKHAEIQNTYENVSLPEADGPVNHSSGLNGAVLNSDFSSDPTNDTGDYVTIKQDLDIARSSPQFDINKLPPVPPRRFVTNNDPLPPINYRGPASLPEQAGNSNVTYDNFSSLQPDPFGMSNFAQLPTYQNVTQSSRNASDSNLPNYENCNIQNGRVVFSKNESSSSHESLNKTTTKYVKNSDYVNVAPNIPLSSSSKRNAKSNPDITMNGTTTDVFDRAPFALSRSPPQRPSSQQSWNKYSPLPSPPGVCKSSNASSTSDLASPSEVDPFLRLTAEQQEVVNNLVSMGFSRPRVARAVESLGSDEKVVVEHLCNVDKLSEAGHDSYQSELALVLFKNDKQKAEVYLNLYKQLQQLGFSGNKIKEALLKFDNDGDKALDFLTT